MRIYWMYWFSGIVIASTVIALFLFDFREVQATPVGTLTVCASGCDETTIANAFTTADGDVSVETISVNEGYNPDGETSLTFPRGLTLQCENANAVIGSSAATTTINIVSTSTIQNCNFDTVILQGSTVVDVVIQNNTFSTSTFSKISISSMTSSTISDNTGFQYFAGGFTDGTFSGNSIGVYDAANINSYALDFDPIVNSTVSNNTIVQYDRFGADRPLVYFRSPSDDVTFVSNTMSTNLSEQAGDVFMFVRSDTSGVVALQNNIFDFEDFAASVTCIAVRVTGAANVVVNNNTFSWYDACIGIELDPSASALSATGTYNIFYNRGSSAAGGGIYGTVAVGTITLINNYNAYYNLSNTVYGDDVSLDSVYKISDPFFRRANVSTADDWQLAPFSDYLDVNGTNDIGAIAGTRGSSFFIDDDGAINYTTVHATTTDIISVGRNGDTFQLAAGSYDPFSISVSGVTVEGVGSSSIIGDASSTSSVRISGSSNALSSVQLQSAPASDPTYTLSQFYLQATSTVSNTYDLSWFIVENGGQQYTNESGGGNVLNFLTNAECGITNLGSDGLDITNYVEDPLQSMHLAAVSVGGTPFATVIVPNQFAATSEAVETMCSGIPGLVVDLFFDDVFTVSGNDYVFNENVITAQAGWSLSAGYSDPAIVRSGTPVGGQAYTSSTFYISGETCALEGLRGVGGGGLNISNDLSDPLENIHLVGGTAGGGYYTLVVPDHIASSLSEFTSECSGLGITPQNFFSGVFTPSDDEFTYNASAITGVSSWSIYNGLTPAIAYNRDVYAGMYITGSNNTIASVTSTANGYNVWFSGSASGNVVSSSAFSSSLVYDVYSNSSQDNSLYNVSFTRASSSIGGVGSVDTYFKTRGYVTNASAEAVSGVGVTFTSADESQTSTVTTTLMGYTPYTDYLLAFTMTSSSVAATNGGQNPFTVSAGAITGYSVSSTSATLASANQTVNLVMSETAPDAPSSLGFSLSTSSIGVSWTDGSSNEDNFILDYITGSEADDFPGTTSSIAANTTSTNVTSLTPNTGYTFRLASQNSAGTSSYVTSSIQYTSPVAPSTPSATVNGATSITLTWTDGVNGSGTVYQVYNVGSSSVVATTTNLTYTTTGLSASTAYTFSIRALHTADGVGYSQSDTVVATTSATPSSSSSGGGAPIQVNPPQVPAPGGPNDVNNDKALILNNGEKVTSKNEISVHINATGAIQMAISEAGSFTGTSFIPFVADSYFLLSAGAGKKTVYVKLRSAQGGETVISGSIIYQPTVVTDQQVPASEAVGACPVIADKAYKATGSTAVYFVSKSTQGNDNTCTKRPFVSSQVFFTYFDNWSEVQVVPQTTLDSISNDSLGFMPWGPKFDPKYGALVKTVNDPKVYLLLGTEKYWITSEDVFVALGYRWNWIEDVDVRLLDTYTNGSEISYIDHHPNYTLVKYANSSKVYRLEPNPTNTKEQVKRYIVNEAVFISLDFRWDRIVTIAETEQYPEGVPLQ